MPEIFTPVGSVVHVLTWVNKSGESVTAYASWDGAVREKAAVARRGWAGLRSVTPDLPADPPESDAETADMYFTWATDESAHIETLIVEQ